MNLFQAAILTPERVIAIGILVASIVIFAFAYYCARREEMSDEDELVFVPLSILQPETNLLHDESSPSRVMGEDECAEDVLSEEEQQVLWHRFLEIDPAEGSGKNYPILYTLIFVDGFDPGLFREGDEWGEAQYRNVDEFHAEFNEKLRHNLDHGGEDGYRMAKRIQKDIECFFAIDDWLDEETIEAWYRATARHVPNFGCADFVDSGEYYRGSSRNSPKVERLVHRSVSDPDSKALVKYFVLGGCGPRLAEVVSKSVAMMYTDDVDRKFSFE